MVFVFLFKGAWGGGGVPWVQIMENEFECLVDTRLENNRRSWVEAVNGGALLREAVNGGALLGEAVNRGAFFGGGGQWRARGVIGGGGQRRGVIGGGGGGNQPRGVIGEAVSGGALLGGGDTVHNVNYAVRSQVPLFRGC